MDIDFPYTGLYPAQGPRGKRPELESQLTSVVGGWGSTNMEQLISESVTWSNGGRSHDHSSALV